jgi:hypothetical protein
MHLLFYMTLTGWEALKFSSVADRVSMAKPDRGIASRPEAGYSSGKHYRCIKENE